MKSNEALEKLNAGNKMINKRFKEFLKSQRNKIYYHIPSNIFLDRAIGKNYRFLMKSQWWTYEDLKKLQMRKLSKLLKFVYKYVPFYQRVFKELNIKPEDIKTIDDLKQFPIIDKTFVNNNYNDFVPKFEFDNLQRACTSGSSGETLDFKWHPSYYHIKAAANYRLHNWANGNWRSKDVHLGAPLFDLKDEELFKRDYKRKKWIFNTAKLDDMAIGRIVKVLNEIKPDFISGYASILYLVADYLRQNKIKLKKSPRSIITTSEIIVDEMRYAIEKSFQTKLYDWYGMIEGCASAGQCEYGNYHMNMEYNIMEFVKKDGVTRIIGTNLENLAFPLIRYDTGDTGEFEGFSCPCKRGLPIMKMVGGRMKNLIRTPNEIKYFYCSYFSKILNVPIREFKILQNKLEAIELFIVKKSEFSDNDLKKIKAHFGNYLGNNVTLNVHFVDNIERGPRGKYQMVVSNI